MNNQANVENDLEEMFLEKEEEDKEAIEDEKEKLKTNS